MCKIKSLIILLFVITASGCAITPTYHTYVDALASPQSANKTTYILLPGNNDTKVDDLQYLEYARYLVRALSYSGFEMADDFESADLAIFMGYGIGAPRTEQYTYSVPTWGQTGVSSSNTFGTINSFGNTATYSGTTTYTPTYGVTGSTTHVGSRTSYDRFLSVVAYDVDVYKETENMQQVWTTTVTSTGSSGDLREVMPILVSAANSYLGQNTGQRVSVNLQQTDLVVNQIKGISQE